MINTVIFDFDGVIADSVETIFKWFQHAASVFGIQLPINNSSELIANFREPFPDFYKFLGFDWDKDQPKIYNEYIAYHSSHPVTLINGIETVIKNLAATPEMKLGIVSSNMQKILEYNLKYHNLSDQFDVVIGIDKDKNSPLKPDPTLLLEALDTMGAGMQDSVYIGDQPSDVLTAYNASQTRNEGQMQTISVTTGFATREKLETHNPTADHIIDHPSEILEKLDIYKN
ncbi:MAG: HAD family hydrolase [Proteobacteria bacterium]|nr:HAD family hydrolase [Pseudomonadota bacterium]